jgi:hypothetical protein
MQLIIDIVNKPLNMSRSKTTMIEDLIIALRNQRVLDAITGAMETVLNERLKPLTDAIADLKKENVKNSNQIVKLQNDLASANTRIDELESYTKRDNLLITGLPLSSFSEATAVNSTESSNITEQSVLKLFNEKLSVSVLPNDLSIVHRIKKRRSTDPGLPVTIVRFTNRKARDAVYGARRLLKTADMPIYINEDLTKATASLYRQARQLIHSKAIHSAWTSAGTLFIKESAATNCIPRKISLPEDLPRSS